jgi:hypothetical protein
MGLLTKDRLGKIFLIIWIPVISAVIGFLMVNHLIAMPLPDDYKRIQDNMPHLRSGPGWLMVHVIYQNCSCTTALTTSLLKRGSEPGINESVIFVGDDPEFKRRFEVRGFSFHFMTKYTIADLYGIEAAPMLLIFSPDNQLEYGGGYFERPSVYRSMDQKYLGRIKKGEHVKALPLYGCAVSARLQKITDPFGIKY